jgi:hypothetical protein
LGRLFQAPFLNFSNLTLLAQRKISNISHCLQFPSHISCIPILQKPSLAPSFPPSPPRACRRR